MGAAQSSGGGGRKKEPTQSKPSSIKSDHDSPLVRRPMTSSSTTADVSSHNTAVPTAAAVKVDECKEDFVFKQLAERKVQCSADGDGDDSLQLSMYDFGGQSVFASLHHFFIKESGIYILCFNMEWLVQESSKKRCLDYLRFWLNSIYMHTRLSNAGTTASSSSGAVAAPAVEGKAARVMIVGSRKDKVKDPRVHQQISNVILKAFVKCPFWASVLLNKQGIGPDGKMIMSFFPVDRC